MSEYKYSEEERQINNVLKYQDDELRSIKINDMSKVEQRISESEKMLKSLGISTDILPKCQMITPKKVITIPSWKEMCAEAEQFTDSKVDLELLFTEEELNNNKAAIRRINDEFNTIHKLDKIDVALCATAGILGAVMDILLVGMPHKTKNGLKAGPLSNYVRDWFEQQFPAEEMEKLAKSSVSKVPYDAQDNRNTTTYVDGLSTYYHRLLSLGHDPLLGLLFGVIDIMMGRMTTIDKTGKIVSQVMEGYSDRKEYNVFAAIAKQIVHFKTDVITFMGLPAPLMGVFNLFQFGSIGDEKQTIAEVVQGMYYEGYDFVHFCSMSIPMMVVEVVIRMGYAFKRIKEGNTIKDSIPFSLNRDRNPKLATMLFIGHSAATAINAGKVYFKQNPLEINYPQWLAFARYSYKQLKWAIVEKPELRDAYVHGKINEKLLAIYDEIDKTYTEYLEKYDVVFE